ncbi:cytochrome oxidase subunit III [Candidatus Poribacteria bacterium]|nr:cytochrome oxidase subunit III [Candidatus Poribacteria bacterium]
MTEGSSAHHAAEGGPKSKMALWWFLASEVMVFGGFLAAYILFREAAHGAWNELAEHLSVPLATFNTLLLLTSSLTIVKALDAAKAGRHIAARNNLAITILLGIGFLVVKGIEYSTEISHGFTPLAGMFWSFYYTLTGLHGLHVIVGIVINLSMLVSIMRKGERFKAGNRVEAAGLYWHFVDVVWVFLFPLLYLSH